MLSLKREHAEPKASPRQFRLRWDVVFRDLSLFISLCLAQLIVWGTLRRRRKERAARLQRIKLVKGASPEIRSESSLEILGDPQC